MKARFINQNTHAQKSGNAPLRIKQMSILTYIEKWRLLFALCVVLGLNGLLHAQTNSISGLASSYCVDSPTATLTGNPAGGTFSGPGISGNTFDPSLAGVGTHNITYTYGTTTYSLNQTGAFSPVSGNGTTVNLSDDQMSNALPIGFNFDFYGTTYSQFYLSSNGFVTFSSGQSSGCCSGQFIPTNGNNPANLIAFAWNDLKPQYTDGSKIDYFTTGTAPNRKLIVNFVIIPHFSNYDPAITTQVILFEGSNKIQIHSTQNGDDGS